jgi:hypothetical protein
MEMDSIMLYGLLSLFEDIAIGKLQAVRLSAQQM